MQIGADKGECAPANARLHEYGGNHKARPGIGKNRNVTRRKAARAFAYMAACARQRTAQQFEYQSRSRERNHCREHKEYVSQPAPITENAARRLSEQLSQDLPRKVSAKDRLTLFIRG